MCMSAAIEWQVLMLVIMCIGIIRGGVLVMLGEEFEHALIRIIRLVLNEMRNKGGNAHKFPGKPKSTRELNRQKDDQQSFHNTKL